MSHHLEIIEKTPGNLTIVVDPVILPEQMIEEFEHPEAGGAVFTDVEPDQVIPVYQALMDGPAIPDTAIAVAPLRQKLLAPFSPLMQGAKLIMSWVNAPTLIKFPRN